MAIERNKSGCQAKVSTEHPSVSKVEYSRAGPKLGKNERERMNCERKLGFQGTQ